MRRKRRPERRSGLAAQHRDCGCTGYGLVMAQGDCECGVITSFEWWTPTAGVVGDLREVGFPCVWCGLDVEAVGMIVERVDGLDSPVPGFS